MARSALFVIDIQNDLATDTKTRIPHAGRIRTAGESILKTARSIMDSSRDKKETSSSIIVFVQHEESPESGSLVRGTEPWKLIFNPRADVGEEILVAKTTPDTFESNPELPLLLRTAGIDGIVAFGIQSECCVESTCKGALGAGFDVTLLSGAHSTYDGDGKTATEIESDVENRLSSLGTKIVGWEDALSRWAKEQRVC